MVRYPRHLPSMWVPSVISIWKYKTDLVCYIEFCTQQHKVKFTISSFSSFMTNQRIGNESSTKGSTSGAGMAYPFEHPTSPTNVSDIRVLQCLVFCVLFCGLLYVLLAIVLSVLLAIVLSVLLAIVLSVLLVIVLSVLLAIVLSVLLAICIVCPFGHCIVCPSFGHCIVCPFGHCIICPSRLLLIVTYTPFKPFFLSRSFVYFRLYYKLLFIYMLFL